MSHLSTAEAVAKALAAPFSPRDVHFRPGSVSGKRAMALAYVDVRAIMDRLDSVLGVDGWQDRYDPLPSGSVVCTLRLRLGEVWIERSDVGGPSKQPDAGDKTKAAFSDALKRAAVKFGIGRYLYRVPALWCDYDPQGRCFTRPPALPAWALPAAEKGDGECIDQARQQTLAKLLVERGKTFAGLCRWLKLPEGAGVADLTVEQYDAALRKLSNGRAARESTSA